MSQRDSSLQLIKTVFVFCGYSLMLVFGTIGNIMNVVLFLRRKLRATSCNNYFLASAFTNLVALSVSIISFLVTETHPWRRTPAFCKAQNYVMTASLQISRFLILTACFDRYALCSSSARLRRFSRIHVARRYVIPGIFLVWMLFPLHVPIFVTVQNATCSFVGGLALYNCLYGIVVIGIIPPTSMFIFSLLIYRNLKVRQQLRQIRPFIQGNPTARTAPGPPLLRKKDQQVLAMLLVQVFAYVVSSTPYTIMLLYVVLAITADHDPGVTDKNSTIFFILFITDMLRFVCPCVSFYLFVLASNLYRREMVLTLSSIRRRLHLVWTAGDRDIMDPMPEPRSNVMGMARVYPQPMTTVFNDRVA